MVSSHSGAPIGIFDSGVGGLTVVQAIRKWLPQETLCYFGDTARVPYGTKSADTIKRYSVEITRFLKSHDVKMIVVACNTVSSVALEPIRELFAGPVIGVVEPGVRAALQATKTGRIGLIGTRSTVLSGTYQRRLLEENPSLHVAAQACPLFVPLVEEGWEEDPLPRLAAERYLAALKQDNLDVLILGCTHYPLISRVIQEVMGRNVTLVSSAEEAAREVSSILKQTGMSAEKKVFKDLFYASDDIASFQRLYERIFGGPNNATFVTADSGFFTLVQELSAYRQKIAVDPLRWFEPV